MQIDHRRAEIMYRWQNGESESVIARRLGLAEARVYQLCVSTLEMLAEPGLLKNPLDRVADRDLLP